LSAANQERLIGLTTPELRGGRDILFFFVGGQSGQTGWSWPLQNFGVIAALCLRSSAANQELLVGLTTPELRGGRAVETLDVGMRKILYTVMGYYKKIL
jgi:hypothetical protein